MSTNSFEHFVGSTNSFLRKLVKSSENNLALPPISLRCLILSYLFLAKDEKAFILPKSREISSILLLNSSTEIKNLPGLRLMEGASWESLSLGWSISDASLFSIISCHFHYQKKKKFEVKQVEFFPTLQSVVWLFVFWPKVNTLHVPTFKGNFSFRNIINFINTICYFTFRSQLVELMSFWSSINYSNFWSFIGRRVTATHV